ncbi:MAG: hypothetical protein PWP07_1932 [Epulopiscium sp.]|jgi:hypothetical protein|uniref:Putative zinc-finger domain-containing protein n=1 Tax=Defluviitalea raffinosedens TaxID=1450156 RepID=A0A7C8HE76_9FIRM|nr:zf-HC2 domain-containing protein [Defluviitalea raffinosedens]KAE9631997.1 hypothetical protein GND95_10795 [Defluviitalea raffinosedens]MBM7686503.1 hypothetical protein [Defluviitalea raffinosedens]MDK2788687.1 hypothetical protein [Candidatus Epulonipiscium sp.]HHW66418.1 hypothetical protein [Candidatus Epulonipiscium sp.]
MECNHADKLMMKYMDGILTMEEAQKLNFHITECESCRESFFTYQMVMDELRDESAMKAPDGFESEVMAKIKDIEIDYKLKEPMPIENISAMLWGVFSLLFGIGVLLCIYNQPVLKFLLENPYTKDWAQAMIPTMDLLNEYINDIKTKLQEFVSDGGQIFTVVKMIAVPVLTVLASIKYYIYRKKKVEI